MPPPLLSDRLASQPAFRWTLWLLTSAWLLGPALAQPDLVGQAQDWAYFNQHTTSAWLSWTVYGELPQWEPFACGGLPAIGNLQGSPVGLTQLMTATFGLLAGQRLTWWLFMLAGLEGMWRYARRHGATGVGGLAAAVLFAFSGRFVQLFHDGQPAFLSFELTPWALLLLERGWRDTRAAVAGGLVMALLFLEGGAVPTPLVAVLLGFVTLLRTARALWQRRDPGALPWWRPIATLALMATIALGLTLWRVLPVVESLVRWPRTWLGDDFYTVGHVVNMLLRQGAQQGYTADGSSLVGMGAAMLFTVAVLVRDKRAVWPLLMTVACVDLATGRAEGLGLFRVVKALPVLHNLRAPFRFSLFAGMFLALGAGVGVAVVEQRVAPVLRQLGARLGAFGPTRAAWLAALLATAAAVGPSAQLLAFGHGRLSEVFVREAPRVVVRPFRQSIGNRWVADVWPAQHRGSLSCFEEQPFPQAPGLRADLPAEEFLDLPEAGTVTRVSWSPHRIELAVALTRPARVLVNQNHHRAWQSNVGHVLRHGGRAVPGATDGVRVGEGLLAVALPAGKHSVVLRFRDPLITAGLAVSALTLLWLGLWGWRRRREAAASEEDQLAP